MQLRNTMETMTFYELLEKYEIEIPEIQRDYIQGREQVQSFQTEFIQSLITELSTGELHLDIIYGSVDNNKFIPLDGQQRLTTLFLLHWYLAWRSNTLEEFLKLNTLNYKTRPTTAEFCKNILCNLALSSKNTKKPSEIIKSLPLFFSKYESDINIQSMLVVLDSIHENYKGKHNFQQLYNKLKSPKCPITFSFLDIDQYNLNDELYIKLNTRGIMLNEFEKIKAKLIATINDKHNHHSIEQKLDNEWLDIFWEFAGKNKDNQDKKKVWELYCDVLKLITRCLSSGNEEIFEVYKDEKNLQKLTNILDILYLCICNKPKKDLPEQWILKLQATTLCSKDQSLKDEIIQRCFKNEENEKIESYNTNLFEARFYAMALFITHIAEAEKSHHETISNNYTKYLRVSDNILYNSEIDLNAIKTLFNTLLKNIDTLDFYESLKDFDSQSLQGTIQACVQEEQTKAKLICKDERWLTAYIEAEKHWYLKGQIKFLLDFSKEDREEFLKYYNTFETIFPQDSENENYEFQRALLTKARYFDINDGLLKWRINAKFEDKLESKKWWRDIFEKECLKSLLDDSKNQSLDTIIKKYLTENKPKIYKDYRSKIKDPQQTQWLYYLIKYKEMWKYSNDIISIGARKGNKWVALNNLNGFWLVRNYFAYPKSAIDYYTYALYLELCAEIKGKNHKNDSNNNDDCITLANGEIVRSHNDCIELPSKEWIIWQCRENDGFGFYITSLDINKVKESRKFFSPEGENESFKFSLVKPNECKKLSEIDYNKATLDEKMKQAILDLKQKLQLSTKHKK